MRKTSQDGGDSTSITSGLDNEVKKSGLGIMKTKKHSIKRKALSHDSDDGVVEPLLQKDKDRTEFGNQSAKFLLSKKKTESLTDKSDDKDKLLADNKTSVPSMTSVPGITDHQTLVNGMKDNNQITKSLASMAPVHNHMNTNVFNSLDMIKNVASAKSEVLVEIDGSKQKSYSPSPLIFTTAKIHSDGKTNPLEPVQVTLVPILSTIEGNITQTSNKNNVGSSSKVFSIPTKPGMYEIKPLVKDRVTAACSSTTDVAFDSGILNKSIISTETDTKLQNISKGTPTSTTINMTCAGPQVVKVTSNSDSAKDIQTLITIKATEDTQIKNALNTKVPLQLNTISTISETTKVTAGKDAKPSSSSAVAIATTSARAENNVKLMAATDGAATQDIERDINKNIPVMITSSLQKPIGNNIPAKVVTSIPKKDEAGRTTNYSFRNKQLQRQNAREPDKISSPVTSSEEISSVLGKEPHSSDAKFSSSKEKTQPKQAESNISNVPKTNAKTLINSPSSSMNTTVTSSTTNKPSVQITTQATKLPVSISKTTTTTARSTNSDIKTPVTNAVSSAVGKSSAVTTTAPTSKSINTTKPMISQSSNLVKTPSTANSKSATSSATAATKIIHATTKHIATTTVPQTATTKISPVSAIISAIPNAVSTTIVTTSRTSTVTTMIPLTTKASTTSKLANSKSATTSARSTTAKPSNKQNDSAIDQNKDGKPKV